MIYVNRSVYDYEWNYIFNEVPVIRYSPCIKYQISADPEIDGTDHFIVAESMNFNLGWWKSRDPLWINYIDEAFGDFQPLIYASGLCS